VVKAAINCEKFGAQGITVHPRPDERHIRNSDVRQLKPVLTTEFNIEGNPVPSFIDLVMEIRPAQVTLVPDAEDVLTSNAGWDTKRNLTYLQKICKLFNDAGIRTSIFIDPVIEMIRYAAETGCNRVELYTEAYASGYATGREKAIEPYIRAAEEATRLGLGLNAGHDLSLENLRYLRKMIPNLLEVSIGHALISDALYLGLENTIAAYLEQLSDF
jgi:pyridoxine 5-phosphate synthase